MTPPDPNPATIPQLCATPKFGSRTAARLAAVQALYQIDASSAPSQVVIGEFLDHRIGRIKDDPDPQDSAIGELIEEGRIGDVDKQLFVDVVRSGATCESGAMISAALIEGWALGRLDSVLRAIMRAGIGELRFRTDIPPEVTVNEYVELSHGFFSGKEPGMVNAVLDRLAKRLRGGEPDAP